MKELTLKEVQKVSLEILVEFDKICKNNSFRYSLGGGTLLGAIRHKGFIPWDDDIDLMMPREDYERFLEYCSKNDTTFEVYSLNNRSDYFEQFAKICDKNTYGTNENSIIGSNMGVGIDIFPIDGLGDSYEDAVKYFNETKFDRELMIAAKWTKFTRSKTRSIIYEPIRFAFYLMSRPVNKKKLSQKINKKCQKRDFNSSRYAACISGVYREKEIMTIESFKDYISHVFENYKFSIISNYDEYLKLHYGNYMELPPKEKQVSHHTTKFYWK